MDRPLILFEGTDQDLIELKFRLQQEGWKLRAGWTLPEVGWDLASERTVCAGEIRVEEDAEAAVMAAARGAGVLAVLPPGDPIAAELYENLRRLGPVEHRSMNTQDQHSLSREDKRLLTLLGNGLSVTEAAAALHLSRRTVERKLAELRRRLGVRTTSEAVVAAMRLRSQEGLT